MDQLNRFTRFVFLLSLSLCGVSFAGDAEGLKLPKALGAEKPKSASKLLREAAQSSPTAAAGVPKWSDQMAPQVNFLTLEGYMRTRGHYFYRCDLGTVYGKDSVFYGTSNCPGPLRDFSLLNESDGIVSAESLDDMPSSLFSMDMRLRVNTTLNVSEDIRVKGTVNFLDNMVLGSTANSLTQYGRNPQVPEEFLSLSQNAPMVGINANQTFINLERMWAEIETPFGELWFGRMPFNFGLGMLYNSGNGLDEDIGDTIDGILFSTRIMGVYLIPGYSLTFSGVNARGGGSGMLGDNARPYYPGERGQRFNLSLEDDVHAFFLTLAKKDDAETLTSKISAGILVYNFGLHTQFRMQNMQLRWPQDDADGGGDNQDELNYADRSQTKYATLAPQLKPLNAKLGIASFWSAFYWKALELQFELTGLFGQIENTDDKLWEGGNSQPLWVLQGAFALQSNYGFLGNKLQAGLDAGWASGDSAPGFGVRSGIRQNPQAGSLDGQQFGNCKAKADDGSCDEMDTWQTNFKFNSSYHVDLILFREIIGTVTDAFYFKPHVAYIPVEGLGIRGDIIASFAQFSDSTPGGSIPLGLEFDLTGFYETDDGFHFQLQYGFLLPFAGLNHRASSTSPASFQRFGTAKTAQAVKFLMGVVF